MSKVFVFDCDGTIANCDHRVELAKSKQWEAFHAAAKDDKPYPEIVRLILNIQRLAGANSSFDDEIIILTGRTENYRAATLDWLAKQEIYSSSILMRAEKDFRKDSIIKLELLCNYFGSLDAALDSVAMIFEDRDQVVEDLRNAGFVVAQVRNGAF